MANGTTMIQRIEIFPTKISSKVVTASVEIGGAIQTATLTFPSSGSGAAVSSVLTGITVEIGFVDLGSGQASLLEGVASQYIPYIKLTATAIVNVQRVKLEIGNISTLAHSSPMTYSAGLAECIRYYRRFGDAVGYYALGSGIATGVTSLYLAIALGMELRVPPTITVGGTVYLRSATGTLYTLSTATIDQRSVDPCNHAQLRFL